MLKKFFLNVLSSFMGAWIAIVVSGLCIFMILMGIIGIFAGKNVAIRNNSVLKINLQGELIERESASEMTVLSLMQNSPLSFQTVETLVDAIEEAKENSDIKAIYLDCGALAAAPASANTVRNALLDFKKKGKKIYAYGDQYSQASYYIATCTDELYVNPLGSINLHGLGGENLFYKGLFDKIGLEFQVVKVGEGKSAVEPYTQEHMSEYAKNQTMELIDTIWNGFSAQMASSRGISSALLDSLINKDIPQLRDGNFALSNKLVKGTIYRHELEQRIADEAGMPDGLEYLVTPSDAAAFRAMTLPANGNNEIAVLYACGGIDTDFGGNGINSQSLVSEIIKLGKNDKVNGLVLRVNSPGGSAYGSEQIWEALEWFKKQGKPVAVSMGDYAASGGYYISCGADRIFADRFTITGSIGIFGLIPNIKGLMDKVGVNAEMVATNPEAQIFSLMEPMNAHQLESLQAMVDSGYNVFVNRCAKGRNIPVDSIKQIADGRPIAATVALRYKLVDQIGSLNDAVNWTANKANLKGDYNIGVYPVIQPNLLMQLFTSQNVSLPPAVESYLIQSNWNSWMINSLKNVLAADKLRAELPAFKLKL